MQDNNLNKHDEKSENIGTTSRNYSDNNYCCDVLTDNVSSKEMGMSRRYNANENIIISDCTNYINTPIQLNDKNENHSSLAEEPSCIEEECPYCCCSDRKSEHDSCPE